MVRIFGLLCLCACSAFAGFDFGTADALFVQRENNLEKIAQARAIYRKALDAKVDDRVYAMQHIGTLAYYEGELLTAEDNHKKRVEIFEQCLGDVKKISPDELGKEVPNYYLWKAACLALWGKSASSFSVAGRLDSLEKAMKKGLALDERFEGGGMHRLMGSVYLKSEALWWIPGLSRFYNPEKALKHIEVAIKMGPQYYDAYLTKAEILKKLGRSDEGLKFLQTKKQEFEGKRLPAGLEPESKAILQKMSEAVANW